MDSSVHCIGLEMRAWLPSVRPAHTWLKDTSGSTSRKSSQWGDHVAKVHIRAIATVPSAPRSVDIETFRRVAFAPETPLIIPGSHDTPALKKWFHHGNDYIPTSFSPYLSQFKSALFPYEFIQRSSSVANSDEYIEFRDWLHGQDDVLAQQLTEVLRILAGTSSNGHLNFHQFSAPLALLVEAVGYNKLQDDSRKRIKQLYIAQSQLDDLPEPLRDDIPTPEIVKLAGRGDIYDSSLWAGLEPTYTPLHRDPNPNLFWQLVSGKTIRLLPPNQGQRLYARVQSELGSMGNSRFRGAEMMQGPERAAFYNAIWGSESPRDVHEATLKSGDSLFIPKGWWHSVLSTFDDGRLNVSVNWWFR
ncbi:hypothetical protein BJ170DRAFT_282660 [Xylariales sp. AK1849]|nr:hypothetical protein BJ170DRAFT_282660 [Xylariales sp. AK1849]